MMKIETEQINKVNKTQGHKTRIELIKNTTKREIEDLEIERVNGLNKIEEITIEVATKFYESD